ncbi:hypothetical protein [Clavibacter zhangzhiyongii]|uniref:hypothetical protein n=1 Tax=Clavibacter zhangzhiyongii TaxID=2768071 RepID=UPI0039E0E479
MNVKVGAVVVRLGVAAEVETERAALVAGKADGEVLGRSTVAGGRIGATIM